MITTHAETVRRYDLGRCDIQVTDWPYECDAQDIHPDHVVYTCVAHNVWWHRPAADWDVCRHCDDEIRLDGRGDWRHAKADADDRLWCPNEEDMAEPTFQTVDELDDWTNAPERVV